MDINNISTVPFLCTVCLGVNKCSHRQPIFFVIIITSQVDLSSKRVVGSKDAQKWAKAHDLRFVCLPLVF